MADRGLALIDQQLVQAAANNMSPAEMEARFDVPAAVAYTRVKEVLSNRDVWTEMERRALLLESAYAMKAQIENATIDTSKPKEVEAYLKTLTTIGEMLDRQSALNTQDMETVTVALAKKLLMLYQVATEHALEILRSQYPSVLLEDVELALEQGLRVAGETVDG